ncbi:MAG: GLPGLI family protein [Flavobacteriaceae bacterium]|nr:GLPGLI family protein [Candidatus Onthonaster equi]
MNLLYLNLLFFSISVYSQDKFNIEYEKRSFLKIEGNNAEYRQMEEEFSKPSYIQLLGDENKCSLTQIDRISNSQGPRTQMTMIGAEKDLESYLDFTTNEMIVSKELDGKIFLITSKIHPFEWKLSREIKKINGYNTKKATFEKDGYGYEAWYSTDIKSKCGPDNTFGLPGLVIEAKMTFLEKPENYTQYKLDKLTIDHNLTFSVPKKGKAISAQEFKTYRKEYDKRLSEMYGNKGVDKD